MEELHENDLSVGSSHHQTITAVQYITDRMQDTFRYLSPQGGLKTPIQSPYCADRDLSFTRRGNDVGRNGYPLKGYPLLLADDHNDGEDKFLNGLAHLGIQGSERPSGAQGGSDNACS